MTHAQKLEAPESIGPADEIPRYSVREAAGYLGLPDSTLRSWLQPGESGVVLIERTAPGDSRLSFLDLVEAHVLAALRRDRGLSLARIRRAIDYTRSAEGSRKVLLRRDLLVDQHSLFLDSLDEDDDLLDIGAGGQLSIRSFLEPYLERIEWGDDGQRPVRFHPLTRRSDEPSVERAPDLVVIDPGVAFGRPVVRDGWIRTGTLFDRFLVGESPEDIAEDYDLEVEEVLEAIRYESLAA